MPLISGLEARGAEVYLRDHHGDNPRDAATVAACRERLGARAVISTRAAHPACSGLIQAGEFRDDIVVADADQDGLTAALKALGVTYPELDQDAAVLDGPMAGKTAGALSPLGFRLVRAWGALPPFGAPGRDRVMAEIVFVFALAAQGMGEGMTSLDRLAAEFEEKVGAAKTLALRIEELAPGVSYLDSVGAPAHDQPTLTGLLEVGAVVTVLRKQDGPIAGKPGGFGSQVSLARTKAGEAAGINLADLVPADWARGPVEGVISNTPFLLHLSPARWEEFRPLLLAAVAPEEVVKLTTSVICGAFAPQGIGSRVIDPASFQAALVAALESYDSAGDKVPGQHLAVLPETSFGTVSAGVGPRSGNPEDYVLRAHRGEVGAYLRRSCAAMVEGLSVVVYTADAYLADPQVGEIPGEVDRVRQSGASHVIVAVLASAGPRPPLGLARFIKNLAGGNKEALAWSADEIRAKAGDASQYWDAWSVVAD